MAVKFDIERDARGGSEYTFFPEEIKIKDELNGRHELPDIEWLIKDICINGQIQPVPIRKEAGKPVLVAGFSRWRAVSAINKRKLLGDKIKIRCVYSHCATDFEAFKMNISENRMRNETTALDDAHNIQRLLKVYNKSEQEIADIYFPNASKDIEKVTAVKWVKKRMKLITLAPELNEAVNSGRLKETAAVAIAKLSEEQQKEIAKANPTGKIQAPKKKTAAKAAKGDCIDTELTKHASRLIGNLGEKELTNERLTWVEVPRELALALYRYLRSK